MGENYTLDLTPLGEVNMGSNGFGVQIRSAAIHIDCLKNEAVFWRPGHETDTSWLRDMLDHSADKQFLVIKGAFSTYVVNLLEGTLSLYKDTIRSPDGVWSEETPILGSETTHINGERHWRRDFD